MLATGAARVGWKIGRGIVDGEEHLEPVIGYLTSVTVVEPGGVYDATGTRDLRVDAEVAVEVGADGGAARFGAALELVDVVRPPHDFETIVVENVWHRCVVFGPSSSAPPPASFDARVLVGGELRAADVGHVDVDETIAVAARLLESVGERLEPGDRIIAGSLVHVPVAHGDEIVVDLDQLGRVGVAVT